MSRVFIDETYHLVNYGPEDTCLLLPTISPPAKGPRNGRHSLIDDGFLIDIESAISVMVTT